MISSFTQATSPLPLPAVPGVEHQFVEAAGTRLHIAEAGSGPPLVLLHGWPQHWWSWRKVICPLAEHYRVICPDIRGLGWSKGSEGSYSWDALATDLVSVLDALGLERVRLVGHDWGLIAGYRACLMHPERFDRFVALAGIHLWQGFATSPMHFVRPWHVWLLGTLGAPGMTRLGLAERALRDWRHHGAFTEDEMAVYLGPIRRPSTIAATVRFDRNVTFHEILRGLREFRGWHLHVPTLHLLGEQDPLTPDVPRNFGPYTDDMRMEVIPDCGHFIAEERPDELLQRLAAFL